MYSVFIILIISILIFISFSGIKNTIYTHKIKDSQVKYEISNTFTSDDLRKVERNQRGVSENFAHSKIQWVSKEIFNGTNCILECYDYLYDHPEYDSINITFPMTEYTIDKKKVIFISGKGKISSNVNVE